MATMNFSVPEEVKAEFEETFAGENKSAIVSDLMRRAVEERRRSERRAQAIAKILRLRKHTQPVTDKAIRKARIDGRT